MENKDTESLDEIHKWFIQIDSKFVKRASVVRRSKLETYVDILKILASQGPMKLTQLTHKTDLSRGVLKQRLDFLIQQYLVEKQNFSRGEIFYVVTERGLKVLNIVVPIIQEAQKIPALIY